MSVVLSVRDVGPCRKELTIEIPAPAVEAEMMRVVEEYSRRVRLPGFRKGKVPRGIVRKRFREEIEKEVLGRLVPRYWRQAEAEQSLDPLMAPAVSSCEMKEEKELKFVATVEVRPEIEVSESRSFDLPPAEVLVGEAEVEEVIEKLRFASAAWQVTDREAASGDLVRLKIREQDGQVAGGESESGGADGGAKAIPDFGVQDVVSEGSSLDEGNEISIEVGDERVWEELRLAITGLKAGQKSKFSRQVVPSPPAVVGAEPLPEPPSRSYQIEMLEVQEKDVPELTDEIVKTLAEVETVAELKQMVESGIQRDKETRRRQEREEKLIDQLIDRHPIELPEGVVDDEARASVQSYAENLARQGVDLERSGLDWKQMLDQARPQASRRVHGRLVLDAVAEADEIRVSEEELEVAIQVLARSNGESALAVRRTLDDSGRLGLLRQQMRREKSVRLLLGEDLGSGDADERADV